MNKNMLQYALIDENNFVVQINLVDENSCLTLEATFNDGLCVHHLQNLYGKETRWIRSCPNGSFRKRPAQTGYVYDPQRDVFLERNFYASWTFDEESLTYIPPIPKPVDGKDYVWNEKQQTWIEYSKAFPKLEPMPDYDVE